MEDLALAHSEYTPRLLEKFFMPAKVPEADGKEHMCLVMPLLGGDLTNIIRCDRSQTGKVGLPLGLVQVIMRDVVKALVETHALGIVHAGLKHDDIMYGLCDQNTQSHAELYEAIRKEPVTLNLPEKTWKGDFVQTFVSQPFPAPSVEQAASRRFYIGDFGICSCFFNTLTIVLPSSLT